MWKDLIRNIDNLKSKNHNFYTELTKMENIETERYEYIYVLTNLAVGFDFYDNTLKAVKYAMKGCRMIEEYIESEVTNPTEQGYLIDLYETCYVILIKENHGYEINQLIFRKINQYGSKIFYNHVSKMRDGCKNNQFIRFININSLEQLTKAFDTIFNFINEIDIQYIIGNIKRLYVETIRSRSNAPLFSLLVSSLIIIDDDYFELYIEPLRNIIIKEGTALIGIIFFNSLKAQKFTVLKRIIDDLSNYKNIFDDNGIRILASVNFELMKILSSREKLINCPDYSWIFHLDFDSCTISMDDTVEYLFKKGLYHEIVAFSKEHKHKLLSLYFYSLVECNLIDEAFEILNNAPNLRYMVNLRLEYLIKMYLGRNDYTSINNILNNVEEKEVFIELLKIIYMESNLKALVEAVHIGIGKFKEFRLYQCFISLIHIDNVDISLMERATLVLQVCFDLDKLCQPQRDWLRDVIFNNLLELVNLKCNIRNQLSDVLVLLELEYEHIFLVLSIYMQEDIKAYFDKINLIYEKYTKIENISENSEYLRQCKILFYKLYSVIDQEIMNQIYSQLMPFTEFSIEEFKLLLDIESSIINSNLDNKIEILKYGLCKDLLPKDIIYMYLINTLSIGPYSFVCFIEKLIIFTGLKSLKTSKIENIIENQKNLFAMIGDERLYERISIILFDLKNYII